MSWSIHWSSRLRNTNKNLNISNVYKAVMCSWRCLLFDGFFLLKVLLYIVYILLCNIKYSFFNYSESAPVSGFIRIQSGGRLQLTMRGEDIKGEEESPPVNCCTSVEKTRREKNIWWRQYLTNTSSTSKRHSILYTHTHSSLDTTKQFGALALSLVGKRFFVFCFCFIFFSRVTL